MMFMIFDTIKDSAVFIFKGQAVYLDCALTPNDRHHSLLKQNQPLNGTASHSKTLESKVNDVTLLNSALCGGVQSCN